MRNRVVGRPLTWSQPLPVSETTAPATVTVKGPDAQTELLEVISTSTTVALKAPTARVIHEITNNIFIRNTCGRREHKARRMGTTPLFRFVIIDNFSSN